MSMSFSGSRLYDQPGMIAKNTGRLSHIMSYLNLMDKFFDDKL